MALALHEFHEALGARFGTQNGCEIVTDYGDATAEYQALRESVAVFDLSYRGRLCLTGADRVRFLNGQVTNNVKDLRVGQGCYAALVTAKGKLQSDLNIFVLPDELLLDFEPGLVEPVTQRLEKFIIADDAQVVDAGLYYGLLSVAGPRAGAAIERLGLNWKLPAEPRDSTSSKDGTLGEIYLMNQPRAGAAGYDLFVPLSSQGALMDKLIAAAKELGGRVCGWQAMETARIEAGVPRFGADMDESNLAPECLGEAAISYSKGCYIGQEVIARVRTYGQVAKSLCGLRLADDLKLLPVKGDKLFHEGKEVGFVTSAVASPRHQANLALGYVRKEANAVGTELEVRLGEGSARARIAEIPFRF